VVQICRTATGEQVAALRDMLDRDHPPGEPVAESLPDVWRAS
jgi:hypothetical protein